MVALPKLQSEAYGQSFLIYNQIILVITHIVHIQACGDQEPHRHAGSKGLPRPVLNLHIIRSPRHQKAHRNIDQNISQPTTGKFEGLSTIEVRNEHAAQAKENNCRTDQKNEHDAQQCRYYKADNSSTKYLSCRHLSTKNNG